MNYDNRQRDGEILHKIHLSVYYNQKYGQNTGKADGIKYIIDILHTCMPYNTFIGTRNNKGGPNDNRNNGQLK